MKLDVLKNTEKQMNFILFLIGILVPIAGFSFVMLFLGGTAIDSVVFIMVLFSVLIRIFEKQLGKYAKYLYTSIFPVGGLITIAVGNDGKFGAISHAYIFGVILAIAYYDMSVVLVNAVVTVATTAVGLIAFHGAFIKLHSLPVWIFILIVYALSAVAAYIISGNTYHMFEVVQQKEEKESAVMDNVKIAFENLQ